MASFDQGIGTLEMDNVNEDLFHGEKVIQENVDGRRVPSSENRWPGWPGDSVFRLLVPSFRVGSLIGRKGEFIKKIVEETRARIKVIDSSPGLLERVVMISAKEDPDSPLPPAMDGLFRVHKCVIGLDGPLPADSGDRISTKLLVASTQSGCLIGKQGSTVKAIQEESNCLVRILRPEDLPVFAIRDDRVVEILGEPHGVHKAVELIASHLRKFLVDRSIISVIETQMEANGNQMVEQMPHHQQWGAPQNAPPMVPVHNYGMSPQYMQPPPRHESFFNPPDYPPPMEKQPHPNSSPYGRIGPVGVHPSSNLPPPAQQPIQPMIKQVTQQMQIPLSYADAVIGSGGASISYIRRASGASVTIQETMGVPGEMTVEINGTASQVQTALQLIQNFMAEASAPPPAAHPPSVGPAMDQGHPSSYQSAPPPPPSGPAVPGVGYGGPMYGGSYGY